MGLLSKLTWGGKSAFGAEEFWTWFQSAEGQQTLSTALGESPSASSAVAKIGKMVRQVNSELAWGMGIGADQVRSFEVSAGGIRKNIPAVQDFVTAAPQMDGWKIVAFKQPTADFSAKLAASGESIDATTVQVAPSPNREGLIDLKVYVPTPAGCPPNTVAELGFIFLDHILGEYLVMTRLGELSFESTLVAPPGVIPLSEFAAQLADASNA